MQIQDWAGAVVSKINLVFAKTKEKPTESQTFRN